MRDILFENNIIVDPYGPALRLESGTDITFRGNEISRNFIHHLGGRIGLGTMAIYNDDCVSGTVMRDNVIYKVQRGCFLGGGVDFIVDGNVFVDCHPAVEIDGRGADDTPMWRNAVTGVLHDTYYAVSGNSPLYTSRWPELKKIDESYSERPDPYIVPTAYIGHNVMCALPDKEKINYTWSTENGVFTEDRNTDISEDELKYYVKPEIYEKITEDIDKKW